MKITCFVATDDGGSRFGEIDVPLMNEHRDAEGNILMVSNSYDSPGVCFIELPADLEQDWHQAPARQVVLVLSGTIEVVTTNNDGRHWSKGEVFIAADVDGRGHRTRAIGGPVLLMFAPLPETFSMEVWSAA